LILGLGEEKESWDGSGDGPPRIQAASRPDGWRPRKPISVGYPMNEMHGFPRRARTSTSVRPNEAVV
jgi:hypothetical protein